MYLLPLLVRLEVEASPLRFAPYLVFPVIAVVVLALLVFALRHRLGKRGS